MTKGSGTNDISVTASVRDHRLAQSIAAGELDRLEAREGSVRRRANLPLRFWRQTACLTTPASDATVARKAFEGGTAAVSRQAERLGLTLADIAERLEVPIASIEACIAQSRPAPMVMLDGEDSTVPVDEAAAPSVENAATILASSHRADRISPSLRFFRPPGLERSTSIRDLLTLLWRLRELVPDGDRLPLDGIVWPKVEGPSEVDLVNRVLSRAEAELGLASGSIRVTYLVESGWALLELADLAQRAASRLAGLMVGFADLSADLGLPKVVNHEPLADWVRAEVIAVAGAIGVPAIDGMTLDYPTIDPTLDLAANRARWLDRLRLAYDDASHARESGMHGKLVGHPAQLFAAVLAFEASQREEIDQAESRVMEYRAAVAANRGSTLIFGSMSDRATDRQARQLLRRETAQGRFDPRRAEELGVIEPGERSDAELANRSQGGALG